MAGLAHLGFGFAATRLKPRLSVIVLLVAAYWLDLLIMVAGAVGIDQELAGYATHSLVGAGVWSVLFGAAVWASSRTLRAGLIAAAVVLSHWVLDAVTWPMTAIMGAEESIPIAFSSAPAVGLGLYRTLAGVIIGETLILGGGIVLWVTGPGIRKRAAKNGETPTE